MSDFNSEPVSDFYNSGRIKFTISGKEGYALWQVCKLILTNNMVETPQDAIILMGVMDRLAKKLDDHYNALEAKNKLKDLQGETNGENNTSR